MKTLNITEAERTELLILVRMELQNLDHLGRWNNKDYEPHRQRRIQIMNELHDKLTAEENK